MPAQGWERDLQWFRTWSEAAVAHGISGIGDHVWCDYPPAYLYVLSATGHLYRLVAPQASFDAPLFNWFLKTPAVLADLLTVLLVFIILKRYGTHRRALLGAALYAFSPFVMYNSAYWGQIDSVSTLLALASTFLVLCDRPRTAGAVLTIACLTKLQVVIFVPPLVLLAWHRHGYRTVIDATAAGLATTLVLLIPFFVHGRIDNVTRVFESAVGRYPDLSMNAHNIWWLTSGGKSGWLGTEISDLGWWIPGIPHRLFGLTLFGLFYTFVLIFLHSRLRNRDGTDNKEAVYFSLAAIAFAFYMLPTQMHERYMYPTFAFLVVLAALRGSALVSYIVLSLTAFLTLAVTLSMTWEANNPWAAALFARPVSLFGDKSVALAIPLTFTLACINSLFLLIATAIVIRRGRWRLSLELTGLVTIGILILSLSTLHRPVWLSDLEPVEQHQAYGRPTTDRDVDGAEISINGYPYDKGIGTHASSKLVYFLGGLYRRFEADIGIQYDMNTGQNTVAFRIQVTYADKTTRELYTSGPIRGYLDPIPINVSVAGAEYLILFTDEGDDGKDHDHTVWARARLSP